VTDLTAVADFDLYGVVTYSIGMKHREPSRTARIEARIAPDALAVVRRAAEIQGRSISDFVVAAAREAAQKAVADAEMVRLSREAQEQFVAMLLKPQPPNAALKRAMKRHRELMGE